MNLLKKFYFLDTNILMHTNGSALFGFEDNTIVLTDRVIEELDDKNHSTKTTPEVKFQVRSVIRAFDRICEFNNTDIDFKKKKINKDIVELKLPDSGGTIKFIFDGVDQSLLPKGWEATKVDNTIIASAIKMSNDHPRTPVIVVTNDRLMKIKCRLAGVSVQEYKNEIVLQSIDDEYRGRTEIITSTEDINTLYSARDLRNISEREYKDVNNNIIEFYENEYVEVNSYDAKSSALCIYKNNRFYLIENNGKQYSKSIGLTPKNEGQYFALDALTRPSSELPLVILKGCAGSGKTLLAIAAGIKAVNKGEYGRVIITRSNTIPENEDLGFLPGTLEEKMENLLDPFKDNLEFITGNRDALQDYLYQGLIEIVSMAYIRGRSIRDAFIIIDEAQNISPMQVKTLITRCGVGSKLVLLGDVTQRDSNKLTERSNGLIYASERMKDSPLTGQVLFSANESVRSELAKDAINRL